MDRRGLSLAVLCALVSVAGCHRNNGNGDSGAIGHPADGNGFDGAFVFDDTGTGTGSDDANLIHPADGNGFDGAFTIDDTGILTLPDDAASFHPADGNGLDGAGTFEPDDAGGGGGTDTGIPHPPDAGRDAGHGIGVDAGGCACDRGTTCLEATSVAGCPYVTGTCTDGTLVTRCNAAEAEATCDQTARRTYYYWNRSAHWLTDSRTACVSPPIGAGGVWDVTNIPAATGAVCSCDRTTSACIETHGTAACAALTCSTGLMSDACTTVGAIAGRCVTRDGQTEIVYYGIGADAAESTCLAATSGETYWFPAGIDPTP